VEESMRPYPYSWKGNCPDPNYQYIDPKGVKAVDNLYYPCCSKKNNTNTEMRKNYLLNGFPMNDKERVEYNTANYNDPGSGILIPGSYKIGNYSMVKLPGEDVFQRVKILKKLPGKKNNEYSVMTENKDVIKVSGINFLRDSRPFRGLKSFTKEQLLECIKRHIIRYNLNINSQGNLYVDNSVPFSVITNDQYTEYIKDVLFKNIKPFTFSEINLFNVLKYSVTSVPNDTYNFYLVLSEIGNFYISKINNKTVESYIIKTFNKKIIFNGFLRVTENGNEYFIIDILYNDGENVSNLPLEQRINLIQEVEYFHSSDLQMVDDNVIFPTYYEDKIYGSDKIISENAESYLIFIPFDYSIDYLLWKKELKNQVILQIINIKSSGELTLGYNNEKLPENLNLKILEDYKPIPNISKNVNVGDYTLWKINRDSYDKLVSDRILSFIKVVEPPEEDYNVIMKIIELSLNPIPIDFFLDSEWTINGEILINDDDNTGLLKII
jgi:hypothetical protein